MLHQRRRTANPRGASFLASPRITTVRGPRPGCLPPRKCAGSKYCPWRSYPNSARGSLVHASPRAQYPISFRPAPRFAHTTIDKSRPRSPDQQSGRAGGEGGRQAKWARSGSRRTRRSRGWPGTGSSSPSRIRSSRLIEAHAGQRVAFTAALAERGGSSRVADDPPTSSGCLRALPSRSQQQRRRGAARGSASSRG